MKKRYWGFLVISLLAFQSCQLEQKNLLDYEKRDLAFSELPDDVQAAYLEEINKKNSNDSDIVISKDNLYTISYDHTGMDDGIWILMTKGFKHHFYINEKHFVL